MSCHQSPNGVVDQHFYRSRSVRWCVGFEAAGEVGKMAGRFGDLVAYMQICVCGVGAANVFSRTTKVACADVAQLVAHHLAKVRVASSSLVIRSGITFGTLNVSGFPVLRWNGRVVRQRSAKPCTRVQFPFPPLIKNIARLAQRESASLTRKRSLVQSQYRALCGCSAVGSASPCQGEGREFESRHPLYMPVLFFIE